MLGRVHANFGRGVCQRLAGADAQYSSFAFAKVSGAPHHQRALAAGDALAGCSVHEVVPQLDAGPVLGQSEVPILPGDTAQDLADRVLEQEHILYPKVLRTFLTHFEPPS